MEDETTPTHDSLTDRQERILRLLPILPTILSTIASSTIIYLVVASGFKTSYKRILFGLSVSDILISITVVLNPFLIPPDSTHHVWAFGNGVTCTMLGFLTQLSLSVLLYNAVLAFYYLFIIRFSVREAIFARRYETWMHAIAVLYPLCTATIGASMDMFHKVEVGPKCWVADYPHGCDEEQGECYHPLIQWIYFIFWLFFCLLSIATINVVLYCHVKRQISRGRRHSMTSERQTKRIREVATQAFLYIAAFFGTFVWTIILRVMEQGPTGESKLFPLVAMQGFFIPCTGMLNLCIYLRPRYLKTRREYPNETRLWAVRRALYGEAVAVSAHSFRGILKVRMGRLNVLALMAGHPRNRDNHNNKLQQKCQPETDPSTRKCLIPSRRNHQTKIKIRRTSKRHSMTYPFPQMFPLTESTWIFRLSRMKVIFLRPS